MCSWFIDYDSLRHGSHDARTGQGDRKLEEQRRNVQLSTSWLFGKLLLSVSTI